MSLALPVLPAPLRLRAASRQRYLPVIREAFPALAARYESTYRHSAYAGDRYRAGLQQVIERLARRHGLRIRGYRGAADDADADFSTVDRQKELMKSPIVRQLVLF